MGTNAPTLHADTVNRFEWTSKAADGTPAGSFTDTTQASTTWTAPQTPGTYTLTCKVDDAPDTIPEAERAGSTRDDPAIEVSVTVHVVEVQFREDTNQKYGFDASYPAVPWKSIEVGQTDTAIADINPVAAAPGVHFMSPYWSSMLVSPWRAAGSPQTVSVTGPLTAGDTDYVEANGGQLGNPTLATMLVAVYAKRALRVNVVLVNEDSDTINGEDVDKAAIETYLKKAFGQAVCEWTRIDKEATPLRVNFDRNPEDGKFDATTTLGLNDEKLAVIRAYHELNRPFYDKIVFLMAKPNYVNLGGVADMGREYAFIFADNIKPSGIDPAQAVAHEIGHCLGLEHTGGGVNAYGANNGAPVDEDNLMHPTVGNERWRLRKNQWDKLHPTTPTP